VDTNLAGKTALVTGAGKNIGRAIAQGLAAAGAQVAVVYSGNADGAAETVRAIAEGGGTARAFGIDLTDLDSIEAGYQAVRGDLGPVDILVNNAAVRPQRKLADVTPELWDTVFAVNVRGPFFLAQKIVPGMVERRWGRIINLGGLHGYKGSARRTQGAREQGRRRRDDPRPRLRDGRVRGDRDTWWCRAGSPSSAATRPCTAPRRTRPTPPRRCS